MTQRLSMDLPSLPSCRRILVLRLSALGDVADIIPSIVSMKKRAPQLQIDWVVKSAFKDLVAPWCDRVIEFPTSLTSGLSFLKNLCRQPYDVIIDFHGNFRSALIGLFTRSAFRLGYDFPISREGAHRFYTHRVIPPQQATSRLDRSLWLTTYLGGKADYQPLDFPEEMSSKKFAQKLFSEAGSRILVFATTSPKGRNKAWPEQRWRRFLEKFVDQKFMLMWGPGEQKKASHLARGLGQRVKVAPKTTLSQMVAMIRRAPLVIGADTGPLHVAHLLNIPTLVLFGPKDPANYGPQYNNHQIIYHKQICSPCRLWQCDHCSCMWAIGVDEVILAAKKLIGDFS